MTREDLLRYKQWLVERGRSLRTAGNKMLRVNQFYRAALGLRPGEGLVTVKDGKFVEKEPEVYTEDEVEAFLNACSPFHTIAFQRRDQVQQEGVVTVFRRRDTEVETMELVVGSVDLINFQIADYSLPPRRHCSHLFVS
jgi:integrase